MDIKIQRHLGDGGYFVAPCVGGREAAHFLSIGLLDEDVEMEAASFLQRMQRYGLLLFYEGQLRTLEAVSNDTLRNALAVFAGEFRLISHRPIFGSPLSTITIAASASAAPSTR